MVKKKKCTQPHVVLFVEGETDLVFFGALLRYYASNSQSAINSYEMHNLKGVSKYNAKFANKLKNEIIPKATQKGRYVKTVCCSYDTDVFEYNERPVVDWSAIRKTVVKLGIDEFYEIKVESMIEDWLLDDMEGLCAAIGLKEVPASLYGANGYEKIQKLFRKAGILYQKGFELSLYIDSLDIGIIRNKRKTVLAGLEVALGAKME